MGRDRQQPTLKPSVCCLRVDADLPGPISELHDIEHRIREYEFATICAIFRELLSTPRQSKPP